MSVRMQLSPVALHWLGTVFPQQSKLSPLARPAEGEMSAEERAELVRQGVLDEQGQVMPAFYAVLATLAHARAYGRIRLAGGPAQAERITFFDGEAAVSMDNGPDALLFEYPATSEATLASLAQLTGVSRFVNSEFSLEGDYETALLLSAVVDLYRKSVLHAYASDQPFTAHPYSLDEILGAANQHPGGPRGVAAYVAGIRREQPGLSPAKAEATLASLIAGGHLEQIGDRYGLAGEAAKLAGNCLILENLIQVDTGREQAGGEIVAAEAIFLQFGLHDILAIDQGGGKVTLESISASMLQEYLRHCLTTAPD